jgi:hypothetical protein
MSTSSGLTGSNPSGVSPLLNASPPSCRCQPQRSAADCNGQQVRRPKRECFRTRIALEQLRSLRPVTKALRKRKPNPAETGYEVREGAARHGGLLAGGEEARGPFNNYRLAYRGVTLHSKVCPLLCLSILYRQDSQVVADGASPIRQGRHGRARAGSCAVALAHVPVAGEAGGDAAIDHRDSETPCGVLNPTSCGAILSESVGGRKREAG